MKKTVCFLLSFCLILSESLAYAFPISPQNSQIVSNFDPGALGKIEGHYQGRSGKTIFYIQDAHDSLEMQLNIAKLIRKSVREYGVRTVFEEGFEGPVPTEDYFGKMAPQARRKTARKLLSRLRLGGAEYAHVLSPREFKLIGADNVQLLIRNVNHYETAARRREIIGRDLQRVENEIQKLIPKYFPASVREWLKIRERYEAGSLDLLNYLKRSRELLFPKQTSRESYPALTALLDLSKNPSAEAETFQFDMKTVFEEMDRMEDAGVQALLKEKPAVQLFEYYKNLRLLERLIDLKLLPEEFLALRRNLKKFKTKPLAEFIAKESRQTVVFSDFWESDIEPAIAFYETAEARDLAVESALKEFLNNKVESSAVLVYGGFHKRRIQEILRKLGLSYSTVIPAMKTADEKRQALYRKLMSSGYHPQRAANLPANASRYPPVYVDGMIAGKEKVASELFRLGNIPSVPRTEFRSADPNPKSISSKVEKPAVQPRDIMDRREFLKLFLALGLLPAVGITGAKKTGFHIVAGPGIYSDSNLVQALAKLHWKTSQPKKEGKEPKPKEAETSMAADEKIRKQMPTSRVEQLKSQLEFYKSKLERLQSGKDFDAISGDAMKVPLVEEILDKLNAELKRAESEAIMKAAKRSELRSAGISEDSFDPLMRSLFDDPVQLAKAKAYAIEVGNIYERYHLEDNWHSGALPLLMQIAAAAVSPESAANLKRKLEKRFAPYLLEQTPEKLRINREALMLALERVFQMKPAGAKNLLNQMFGALPETEFFAAGLKVPIVLPYEETIAPDQATEIFAESLVEKVLPELETGSWIFEIGSGAGAVASISAAYGKQHAKDFKVIAADIVFPSVITTRGNLVFRQEMPDQTTALYSNLFSNLGPQSGSFLLNNLADGKPKKGLALFNVPIMPVDREVLEKNGMNAYTFANYDYYIPPGMSYSDGLGVFREFLVGAKDFFGNYFQRNGEVAVVLPAFVGEGNIREIFLENGFTAERIKSARRKVRPGGFTWNQMELIEKISGYKFFDENGQEFLDVQSAKKSGKDIYFDTVVYKGVITPAAYPVLDPAPAAQSLEERNRALHAAITQGLTFERKVKDDQGEQTKVFEISGVKITLPEPYYSEEHTQAPPENYQPGPKMRFELLVKEQGSSGAPELLKVYSRTKKSEVVAPVVITVDPARPLEIKSIEISGGFLGEEGNQEFQRRIFSFLQSKGFLRYRVATRLSPGKNYFRRALGKWLREGRLRIESGATELYLHDGSFPAHMMREAELIQFLEEGFPRDSALEQEDLYLIDLRSGFWGSLDSKKIEETEPGAAWFLKIAEPLKGKSPSELHSWYLQSMYLIKRETKFSRAVILSLISQKLREARERKEISLEVFNSYFFSFKNILLPQFPSLYPEIERDFRNLTYHEFSLSNRIWQLIRTLKKDKEKFYVRTLGGAGAGKSTSAEDLMNLFTNRDKLGARLIATDNYLQPRSVRREKGLRGAAAYRLDLLRQDIDQFEQGKIFTPPQYVKQTGEIVNGTPIDPANVDVLIFDDAFVVAMAPELEKRIGANIYFEDPDPVRFLRRLERDKRERGQDDEEIAWTFAEAQITEMGPLERDTMRKADIVVRVSSKQIAVRKSLMDNFLKKQATAYQDLDYKRPRESRTDADSIIYSLHREGVYALPALLNDSYKAAFTVLIKNQEDLIKSISEAFSMTHDELEKFTTSSSSTIKLGSIPPDSVNQAASALMMYFAVRLYREFPERYRGKANESFHQLASEEMIGRTTGHYREDEERMIYLSYILTDSVDPMILVPMVEYRDDKGEKYPGAITAEHLRQSLEHQNFYSMLIWRDVFYSEFSKVILRIRESIREHDSELDAWIKGFEEKRNTDSTKWGKIFSDLYFPQGALKQDETNEAYAARQARLLKRIQSVLREDEDALKMFSALGRIQSAAQKDALQDLQAIVQLGLAPAYGFEPADLQNLTARSEIRKEQGNARSEIRAEKPPANAGAVVDITPKNSPYKMYAVADPLYTLLDPNDSSRAIALPSADSHQYEVVFGSVEGMIMLGNLMIASQFETWFPGAGQLKQILHEGDVILIRASEVSGGRGRRYDFLRPILQEERIHLESFRLDKEDWEDIAAIMTQPDNTYMRLVEFLTRNQGYELEDDTRETFALEMFPRLLMFEAFQSYEFVLAWMYFPTQGDDIERIIDEVFQERLDLADKIKALRMRSYSFDYRKEIPAIRKAVNASEALTSSKDIDYSKVMMEWFRGESGPTEAVDQAKFQEILNKIRGSRSEIRAVGREQVIYAQSKKLLLNYAAKLRLPAPVFKSLQKMPAEQIFDYLESELMARDIESKGIPVFPHADEMVDEILKRKLPVYIMTGAPRQALDRRGLLLPIAQKIKRSGGEIWGSNDGSDPNYPADKLTGMGRITQVYGQGKILSIGDGLGEAKAAQATGNPFVLVDRISPRGQVNPGASFAAKTVLNYDDWQNWLPQMLDQSEIKAVVFDWDGTLADADPYSETAQQKILYALYLDLKGLPLDLPADPGLKILSFAQDLLPVFDETQGLSAAKKFTDYFIPYLAQRSEIHASGEKRPDLLDPALEGTTTIFSAMWPHGSAKPYTAQVKEYAENLSWFFTLNESARREALRRFRVIPDFKYEKAVLYLISSASIYLKTILGEFEFLKQSFQDAKYFHPALVQPVIGFVLSLVSHFFDNAVFFLKTYDKKNVSALMVDEHLYLFSANPLEDLIAHELVHWLVHAGIIKNDIPLVAVMEGYVRRGNLSANRALETNEGTKFYNGVDMQDRIKQIDALPLDYFRSSAGKTVDEIIVDNKLQESVELMMSLEAVHSILHQEKFPHGRDRSGNENSESTHAGFDLSVWLRQMESLLKQSSPGYVYFVPAVLFFKSHIFSNKDLWNMDEPDKLEALRLIYAYAFLFSLASEEEQAKISSFPLVSREKDLSKTAQDLSRVFYEKISDPKFKAWVQQARSEIRAAGENRPDLLDPAVEGTKTVFSAMWPQGSTKSYTAQVKEYAENLSWFFSMNRRYQREVLKKFRVIPDFKYEKSAIFFTTFASIYLKRISDELGLLKQSFKSAKYFGLSLVKPIGDFLSSLAAHFFDLFDGFLDVYYRKDVAAMMADEHLYLFSVSPSPNEDLIAHELVHWLEHTKITTHDVPLVAVVEGYTRRGNLSAKRILKTKDGEGPFNRVDTQNRVEWIDARPLDYFRSLTGKAVDEILADNKLQESVGMMMGLESVNSLVHQKEYKTRDRSGNEDSDSTHAGFDLSLWLRQMESLLKQSSPGSVYFVPAVLFLKSQIFTNDDQWNMDEPDKQEALRLIYGYAFLYSLVPEAGLSKVPDLYFNSKDANLSKHIQHLSRVFYEKISNPKFKAWVQQSRSEMRTIGKPADFDSILSHPVWQLLQSNPKSWPGIHHVMERLLWNHREIFDEAARRMRYNDFQDFLDRVERTPERSSQFASYLMGVLPGKFLQVDPDFPANVDAEDIRFSLFFREPKQLEWFYSNLRRQLYDRKAAGNKTPLKIDLVGPAYFQEPLSVLSLIKTAYQSSSISLEEVPLEIHVFDLKNHVFDLFQDGGLVFRQDLIENELTEAKAGLRLTSPLSQDWQVVKQNLYHFMTPVSAASVSPQVLQVNSSETDPWLKSFHFHSDYLNSQPDAEVSYVFMNNIFYHTSYVFLSDPLQARLGQDGFLLSVPFDLDHKNGLEMIERPQGVAQKTWAEYYGIYKRSKDGAPIGPRPEIRAVEKPADFDEIVSHPAWRMLTGDKKRWLGAPYAGDRLLWNYRNIFESAAREIHRSSFLDFLNNPHIEQDIPDFLKFLWRKLPPEMIDRDPDAPSLLDAQRIRYSDFFRYPRQYEEFYEILIGKLEDKKRDRDHSPIKIDIVGPGYFQEPATLLAMIKAAYDAAGVNLETQPIEMHIFDMESFVYEMYYNGGLVYRRENVEKALRSAFEKVSPGSLLARDYQKVADNLKEFLKPVTAPGTSMQVLQFRAHANPWQKIFHFHLHYGKEKPQHDVDFAFINNVFTYLTWYPEKLIDPLLERLSQSGILFSVPQNVREFSNLHPLFREGEAPQEWVSNIGVYSVRAEMRAKSRDSLNRREMMHMVDFGRALMTESRQTLAKYLLKAGKRGLGALKTKEKFDKSFVTEVDVAIQELVLKRIRQFHPDHYLLGEETLAGKNAEANAKNFKSDFVWVLDPIDGTKMFSQGNDGYGISLALYYKGKPVLGMIYSPMWGGVLEAHEGRPGAYLNKDGNLTQMHLTRKPPMYASYIARGTTPLARELERHMITNPKQLRPFEYASVVSGALLLTDPDVGFHADIRGTSWPAIWDIAAILYILDHAGAKVVVADYEKAQMRPFREVIKERILDAEKRRLNYQWIAGLPALVDFELKNLDRFLTIQKLNKEGNKMLNFLARSKVREAAPSFRAEDGNKVNPVILALGSPSPHTFVNLAGEWKKWNEFFAHKSGFRIPIVASTGRGRGTDRLIHNTQEYYDIHDQKKAAKFKRLQKQLKTKLTEARVIKFILEMEGVPKGVVITEEVSTNTKASMLESAPVIKAAAGKGPNPGKPVKLMVITDAFHRLRALYTALENLRGQNWQITAEAPAVPDLERLHPRDRYIYLEYLLGYPEGYGINNPHHMRGSEIERIYQYFPGKLDGTLWTPQKISEMKQLFEFVVRSEIRMTESERRTFLKESQDNLEFLARTRVEGASAPLIPADFSKINPVILTLGSPSAETFINLAQKWKEWDAEYSRINSGRHIPVVASTGRGRGVQRLIDNVEAYYQEKDPAVAARFYEYWTAQGDQMTEAKAIRFVLIEEGVPQEAIFTEEISHNTELNITRSREVIERQVVPQFADKSKTLKVVLISDGFHLLRGQLYMKQYYLPLGWEITTEPLYVPQLNQMGRSELLDYLEFLIGYPQDYPGMHFSETQRIQRAFPDFDLGPWKEQKILDMRDEFGAFLAPQENGGNPPRNELRRLAEGANVKGTLLIDSQDLRTLTEDEWEVLYKMLSVNRSGLRLVVYHEDLKIAGPADIKLNALYKLKNVRRAAAEANEALKRYGFSSGIVTHLSPEKRIQKQDPHALFSVNYQSRLKFFRLRRQPGEIGAAAIYTLNNGRLPGVTEKDGFVTASEELSAALGAEYLSHLVVAWAA